MMHSQLTKLSPEAIRAAVTAKGPAAGWRSDGIDTRVHFLQALATLVDQHGDITRTQQQIATALGLKRRTVEVLLRSLADAGALEYQPSPGGTPATYSLQPTWFDDLPAMQKTAAAPTATAQSANRQTAKTASPRRPPSRRPTEQPWQQAVDAVRTELGGQLQALARQVQILSDRLGVAGGEPQASSDEEQEQQQEGQDETDPAPASRRPGGGVLDAQALLFQMDARLQTFADTLATRLEHVLSGASRLSPELHTGDTTEQCAAVDEGTDNVEQTQQRPEPRRTSLDATAEAEVEAEIEQAQTENTQGPIAIEDEQDDQAPPAADAEHNAVEQTDNEQAEALQTEQAGQISPAKRRPGRPLKDPATLNRLEARADILFEQLTAILQLTAEQQAKKLIDLARAALDWHAHGDSGVAAEQRQ